MGTLKLNAVEASDQGELHAASELLLALLYLIQTHLVGGWGEISTKISHFLAATDCRGSPSLKAKGHLAVGCSTSMAYLHKDQAFLLMDGISDLLPAFGLLFSIEIS